MDIVIDEIVDNKDFGKPKTEKETFESIEESKYPQEFDDGGVIILDEQNEKELSDPRVQAIFKSNRHIFLSISIKCQNYCEIPKRTNRANENI